MTRVIVSGSFDDLRLRQVRLLHEASRLGPVSVRLWPDEAVAQATGQAPKFPFAERRYLLESLRFVAAVVEADDVSALPPAGAFPPGDPVAWVFDAQAGQDRLRDWCRARGIPMHVLGDKDLAGLPEIVGPPPSRAAKKVVVTGCYDWLHSGHVRFFEEAAQFGDLYAIVGHDDNLRLLKGAGHPLFPAAERRYLVGAVRLVAEALISTGHGWMDAEPEVLRLKPDLYIVNEDGDRPEKRAFCADRGIAYRVLKRLPRPGLMRRESKQLRGF